MTGTSAARPHAVNPDGGRVRITIGPSGPVLELRSADVAAVVAQVLDTFNAARAYRGQLPIPELLDVVAACRQFRALAQLVPQSEPTRDAAPRRPTQWLSTADLAHRLDISARAVTKRIAAGTLTAVKVGGRWLIDVKEFTHAA